MQVSDSLPPVDHGGYGRSWGEPAQAQLDRYSREYMGALVDTLGDLADAESMNLNALKASTIWNLRRCARGKARRPWL